MMLLEHHGKALLARAGLPVPDGLLVTSAGDPALAELALPAVVKAQVPVGGRGKAGGIAMVRTREELEAAVAGQLAMTIKGLPVRAVRIEQPVTFAHEAYVSLSVDAGAGQVRILMSALGGVEVEDPSMRVHLRTADAAPDPAAVLAAYEALAAGLPQPARHALTEAGPGLVQAFFGLEALLVEVNPFFIQADGGWVLGDAKVVLDDNAQPRSEALTELLTTCPALYPEAALKLEQGFDFVIMDPDGDIGLVTTGAGLSMQLVDELTARGHSPFNFCDIRTGGFRGDPARLIQVLQWVARGRNVRSVLINFFAGLTDLGEIARLLMLALDAVPELTAPVTARMIGNGLDAARAVIAQAGDPIVIETDLERAVDLACAKAGKNAREATAHG